MIHALKNLTDYSRRGVFTSNFLQIFELYSFDNSMLCLFFPGEPQSFLISVKRVRNAPLDLYFVVDQSTSMNSSLETFKELISDLCRLHCYLPYSRFLLWGF